MTLTASIAVCALLGLLFLIAAIRRLRRRRLMGGMAHGAAALIFFLAAACAMLVGTSLSNYQRLSFEQPAGELQFARVGTQEFNATLTYPNGERANFALHGDDLPAAAEADFFRADGHPSDPTALQPVMALFPARLLFQREKKTGPRANAGPCPALRSGCL